MKLLDTYLAALRDVCSRLPDPRKGLNRKFTMVDIAMSAFSIFFLGSPSFLAHQRALTERLGTANTDTLFGIRRIPGDAQIRRILDGIDPALFDDFFAWIIGDLAKRNGLKDLRRLGGRVPIALDGTEYHCSYNVHCPHCSKRKRSNGETQFFHSALCAVIVAPGQSQVLALPPEFITPQDGVEKEDCEINAGKRWLQRFGEAYAELKPVYLGDDLFSNHPFCIEVLKAGGSFIFVCKPTSHKTLYEYLHGCERNTKRAWQGKGKKKRLHVYQWMNNLPIRDGDDELSVNWFQIDIYLPNGERSYRNSFVTDIGVTRSNVAELAACGRTRWKVENEGFNILKNNAYSIEHNFGHGKNGLACLFLTFNLIAFLIHTSCRLLEELWHKAEKKIVRKYFLSHLMVLLMYHVFDSWEQLLITVLTRKPPPARC